MNPEPNSQIADAFGEELYHTLRTFKQEHHLPRAGEDASTDGSILMALSAMMAAWFFLVEHRKNRSPQEIQTSWNEWIQAYHEVVSGGTFDTGTLFPEGGNEL